jgi:hypothetical protein
MVFNGKDSKCFICGTKWKKGFDAPGLRFNFLSENPLICEGCVFDAIVSVLKKKRVSKHKWVDVIAKYIELGG